MFSGGKQGWGRRLKQECKAATRISSRETRALSDTAHQKVPAFCLGTDFHLNLRRLISDIVVLMLIKTKSSSGWMHHWTPPRSSRRRGRPSAPRPEPGASSRGFRSAGSRPARPVLRTSRDNAAPSRMKGQSSSVLVGLCERERGDLMAVF